jgi:hypothetical protein
MQKGVEVKAKVERTNLYAIYHFTEMPVWQLADEVVGDIYKLTEVLPKREDYA